MLWVLIGALVGVGIAIWRWRRDTIRVEGRFFPYQGSGKSLLFRMAIYGTILALAFLGAGAATERAGRQDHRSANDAVPEEAMLSNVRVVSIQR